MTAKIKRRETEGNLEKQDTNQEVTLLRRIYRLVLAMALVSLITGCQSRMKPSGNITITKETAMVENQLSNGILIAYTPDEAEDGERGGSASQMTAAARMIGEVTGGTLVSIGKDANPPEDYGTVFLGISGSVPELPDNLRVFLEEQDLIGKTIIPFLVADEGNLEFVMSALYELEPEAEFLDGITFESNHSGNRQEEVNTWLSNLGFNH